MTIPHEFKRLPELIATNFLRWKHRNPGVDVQDLSERTLKDVGFAEPLKRDLDSVKPFWMP